MNKFEAKNYLIKLAKGKDSLFCSSCPIVSDNGKFLFEEEQKNEIYNFLHSYKLYNTSICSSKFLFICLKYKPNQIRNIIDYAKKITEDKNIFLDYGDGYGGGCPCNCLSKLSKYILNKKELLDIE